MYGLGRKRSKFGRYCESKGLTQQDIVKASDLNKETVSRLFVDDEGLFRGITKLEAIKSLNKLTGENKKVSDFW